MTAERVLSFIKSSQTRFAFILSVILLITMMAGYALFIYLQSAAVTKHSKLYSLISLESFTMNRINSLIYSTSHEERISGYYSIIDTGLYNRNALIERYHSEKNVSVRKTILFVIYFMEKDNAPEIFKSLNFEDEELKQYSDCLVNDHNSGIYDLSIRF
ncbi:MAG: hypothetical protein JXK07_00325 [Spirochaetes bacterium]|nr:hypothetical protein [Spirochaetota bacterium]